MRAVLIISCVCFIAACTLLAPPRTFKVKLFLLEENGCISRLENEEIIEYCPKDNTYPNSFVCMDSADYNKERSYQALLIKSCRKWK